MFPLIVANLFDPEQRRKVLLLCATIEKSDGDLTDLDYTPRATKGAVFRKLPRLLRLGSGEILALAVRTFGPGVQFDLKELAERTGAELNTILSKNRTFAKSCDKRGLRKGWLFEEHGGSPRKFSVRPHVHAEVLRLLAERDAERTEA